MSSERIEELGSRFPVHQRSHGVEKIWVMANLALGDAGAELVTPGLQAKATVPVGSQAS